MIVINTERLNICKITMADADSLSEVLSDPMIMKYSTVGVHTQQQIKEFILNCQKNHDINGFGHWAIYDVSSNALVGICGLNKHDVDGSELIHINYRLARAQQGKGYATEAVNGVLDFAMTKLNLDKIYAIIEPQNKSSLNVVKRTGFEFIKSATFRGLDVELFSFTLSALSLKKDSM